MEKETGVNQIGSERARQIEEELYDDAHDDNHDGGELAMAAVCYAAAAANERIFTQRSWADGTQFVDPWPWDRSYDKRDYNTGGSVDIGKLKKMARHKRIDLLVKAGALIAAEIDRLQRTEKK